MKININIKQTLQDILSGNILEKEFFRRQYRLVALVVVLIFISIYSGFQGEKNEQKIQVLQKQIKEARYELLDISAQYTEMTRPSTLNQRLKEENSRVKESVTPPTLVK